MVKMKKAALGAIGMASLKALDIGAGEEAISVKVETAEESTIDPAKRLKKKRSGTSLLKDNKERTTIEDIVEKDHKNDALDETHKHRRRHKATSGSEKNSDVVFLVGEEPYTQRIPAHSWILIKESPVFRAMFRGPLSPVSSTNASNSHILSKANDNDIVNDAQLDPVIEQEDEENSVSDSLASKASTEKVCDISIRTKSSTCSSINLSSNENMTMKTSIENTCSKDKGLSKDICNYTSSDKSLRNTFNIQPVQERNKELYFSKGNNAENESVSGTSDNPSLCKKGEKNSVCITSNNMHDSINIKSKPSKNLGSFVGGKKASIAVSDVDGRAFDILLKYLYNESIDLPSVMTALTTLYAAHKYMCPGLAKEVVTYLKSNLTENNVLLVLQHICLYCSSATDQSSNTTSASAFGNEVPVTTSPVSFFATSLLAHGGMGLAAQISCTDASQKINSSDHGIIPSAPPPESPDTAESKLYTLNDQEDNILSPSSDMASKNVQDKETANDGILNENLVLEPETTEDDLRDFENGMSVEDSNGGWGPRGRRKANCCKVLMRKCLELIDVEASSVLACEDIEDLEVTSLRMIVCRETLCIQSETEVFTALGRWSDRECRRQHLELTPSNRRRVLEGCQYLVRYLTMTRDEFVNVPYRSGLLCKDEEEALLAQISCRGTAKATAAAVDLPEHLWQWQTIMRTKRRGKAPAHGIQISSGRKFTYSGLGSSGKHRRLSTKKGKIAKTVDFERKERLTTITSGDRSFPNTPNSSLQNSAANGANAKEKFNIVEEFFVCLACIFD